MSHKKKSKQKEGRRNVSNDITDIDDIKNDISDNLSIQKSVLPHTPWPISTWKSPDEPEDNQLD